MVKKVAPIVGIFNDDGSVHSLAQDGLGVAGPLTDLGATAPTLAGMQTAFNDGSEAEKSAFQASVSGGSYFPQKLSAIFIGNSIAQNALWISSGGMEGYNVVSEYAAAQRFFPLCTNTTTVTPVAYVTGTKGGVDRWGNYGFAGKRAAEILTDMIATWQPVADAAGLNPDIIYVTAVDNDIGQGRTFAQIVSDMSKLINYLRTEYPGVILHLMGPRADYRLTTQALIDVMLQTRTWMLSLDNGRDTFVTDFFDGTGHSNIANPAYCDPAWTDGLIHPNNRGAIRNGRRIAQTDRRIAAFAPKCRGRFTSVNAGLAGSVAVNSGGATGTLPTGLGSALATTGTIVCTAGNPGPAKIVYTPPAALTEIAMMLSQTTGLPTTPVGGYVVAKIVSGASGLQDIFNVHQTTGAATLKTRDRHKNGTTGMDGGYVDGDVLYFTTPKVDLSASLTGVYEALYITPGPSPVPIELEIQSMGYIV